MNTPLIMTQPIVLPTLCSLLLWHPKKILHRSLLLHYTTCVHCPKISGHVFYESDGIAIYVCDQGTSLALQIFESASYTHCSVFKYLSRSKPVLFNMRWHSCRDEFLCWFIYPVQVYEDHLSILTLRTLQSSARMASVSFKGQLKENIVATLTGHVLSLHDCLTTMTRDELFCELRALAGRISYLRCCQRIFRLSLVEMLPQLCESHYIQYIYRMAIQVLWKSSYRCRLQGARTYA